MGNKKETAKKMVNGLVKGAKIVVAVAAAFTAAKAATKDN